MRVRDLRKWLDDEERKWSSDDNKYLGEFGDIQILSPKFQVEDDHVQFKGWDYDNHVYWDITGLGILIDTKA